MVSRAVVLLLMVAPAGVCEPYPDRPGKKTVQKICGNCHGLKLMESMRKTRAQWQTSVDDMLTRGMNASEDEMAEAVEYLAKYLSRLNVNEADAGQLADVLNLEPGQASAIVGHRGKHGPYKDFDALVKTPGVDAGRLAAQRDRIAFRTAGF